MKYVFKENSYYADYLMKMKTMIVLYDVYCVVTYPEYSHVRNRYYKNPTSFKCFKIIVFWHLFNNFLKMQ